MLCPVSRQAIEPSLGSRTMSAPSQHASTICRPSGLKSALAGSAKCGPEAARRPFATSQSVIRRPRLTKYAPSPEKRTAAKCRSSTTNPHGARRATCAALGSTYALAHGRADRRRDGRLVGAGVVPGRRRGARPAGVARRAAGGGRGRLVVLRAAGAADGSAVGEPDAGRLLVHGQAAPRAL